MNRMFAGKKILAGKAPVYGRESGKSRAFRWSILAGSILFVSLAGKSSILSAQKEHHPAQSRLELTSSDTQLVHAFAWAKQQALAYVFDGDPVGPWYEAALPGRRAFCMRDVSHQVMGAQALGLARYNHNMLRRFAENISASRDWCSYWEINSQNQPAPVDYINDKTFWYNLPANFDVLDASYRMFLWTGDSSYIHDPVFQNFYDRTVMDYVSHWDLGIDRVMQRNVIVSPPPFFRGDPSYNESRRDIMVGVDLLATQYAAYKSYAEITAMRGDKDTATLFERHAGDVKQLINTRWWNEQDHSFYSFMDQQHQMHGRAGADLLYRNAVDLGEKTAATLHILRDAVKATPEDAVEPASYYAEVLYRYGQSQDAYGMIMNLSRAGRKRQEYPEVSYSVIGAIVTGLMGVNVHPAASADLAAPHEPYRVEVETLPQLTSETVWVELRHLPVQDGFITVRHEREKQTAFTNEGSSNLTWQPCFAGAHGSIIVDGSVVKAQAKSGEAGQPESCTLVTVKPGATAHAKLGQ